jgi:hypothetical protein
MRRLWESFGRGVTKTRSNCGNSAKSACRIVIKSIQALLNSSMLPLAINIKHFRTAILARHGNDSTGEIVCDGFRLTVSAVVYVQGTTTLTTTK